MHGILMRGTRGEHKMPGEFRQSQNWIGGSGPGDAFYVPPPPEHLNDCLSDWERFVNERDVLPDLIQCAILHATFETIHPFLDGNGRIGRLLITLFLIERSRLTKPLLYVSDAIERTRSEYYDALQRTRTHGDWTGWIRYFLRAVYRSADDATLRARAMFELHDELRATPELAKKHRARNLISELFKTPYTTVATAAESLDVQKPTAAATIGLLERLGVLEEVTGRQRGRVWVAKPILRLMQD